MNKLLYIILLVFLNCFTEGIVAQSNEEQMEEPLVLQIDTSEVTQRFFSENLSERYQGEEFEYESSVEGEAQNFIARALFWVIRQLSELFGFDVNPQTLEIIEFIFYALLIIFALYIVVRLLVGQGASAVFSKKSSSLAPLNIQEEHIESIDLDQFIRDALAQGNYRLAVRYMYLKALKELSFRNHIDWHFEKTNEDYYLEIENIQLKDGFKKLSYVYDYVWYGEFDLDQSGFDTAQQDFKQFTKNLEHAR